VKIFVKVKPRSKKDGVLKIDTAHFEVRTTSPSREGRANASVIEALARRLGVPKSKIEIIAGSKSRQKVFEILE